MLEPIIDQKEIDTVRRQGFRPEVVGCFAHNKKVLFCYQSKYRIWEFSQGGVNNHETLEQALSREMVEELGRSFWSHCETPRYLGETELIFPKQTQGSRELVTDNGDEVFMIGKKYYFFMISVRNPNLDIKETKYNGFQWKDRVEARELTADIYQKGKQRVIQRALSLMEREKVI